MDHGAIMKKDWGLLDKILSGKKKIESRWYKLKCKPWNSIKKGDMIYFKNSSAPIIAKAKVKKVIQFSNLNPKKVKEILDKYAKADGIDKNQINKFYKLFKDKKYCLLIFLENVKSIKTFNIDKAGFGAMAAWITVSDIDVIKK